MKKLNFFQSIHSPYYIFGLDYRQSSAGVRALHYLCHALNELGEEAYISASIRSPYLRTPKLTQKIIAKHLETGREPIAVYPEVVPGNPFQAEIIARWLLNKPGHLGGDTVYADRELLFVYQKTYAPQGKATNPLFIPTIDGRIFNNRDNPHDGNREGACFYAHKYLVFGGQLTQHVIGATSLCQDIKRTHEEIAEILRRSEVMYCYEPSAIVTEALYCGCPVVMIPSGYLAANYDYKILQGPGVEIGDDRDALNRAKASLKNLDSQAQSVWGETTLLRFVQITQKVVGERVEARGEQKKAVIPRSVTPSLGRNVSAYSTWRHSRPSLAAGFGVPAGVDASARFHVVIMCVGKAPTNLERTLESIASQIHSPLKVSIFANKAAPPGFVNNEEIRWIRLAEVGFVDSINEHLLETESRWLLVIDAGDTLEDHALATIGRCAAQHPEWKLAYMDEDSVGDGETPDWPYFKSDYSIDFHRAAPYALGGGLAVRRDFLNQLGGFDASSEGVETYDFVFRAYEAVGAQGIGHISDVLYHRSSNSGNSRLTPERTVELRKEVLLRHLERTGAIADVEDGVFPGTFRIRYRFDDSNTVSIIIPTHNGAAFLQRCIGAIAENTDYKNWELIIVDQGSDDSETLKFLELLPQMGPDTVRILRLPQSASLPAMINAGAVLARGQYLLLMSDAAAPLQRDWLDEMLGYVVQPGVGVVGAKMIGPDANISFAGYVLGLEGLPAGLHDLNAPPDALGYFGALQVPGNPSAVSATCMLTPKALFDELGGFDEQSLADGYSDVDYCLKSWQAGKRVVWTPFALLLQEHMSEPPKTADPYDDDEEAEHQRVWHMPTPVAMVMFDRWLDRIAFDPAYNRNLSLALGAFEIETHPALTWDPEFHPVPRILAHTGDRYGSGEYRLIAPLRALVNSGNAQGWDTKDYLSTPELARMSPDVVVFQRQIKPHQIRLIEHYARYSKAFRVFELDDLMTNIQIGNQAWSGYQDKDLVKRFRQALDLCDRFVVSTEYLAQEYRKYKADIVVAPNYLERARWDGFTPKRRQGRKPRVGWAGSVTHEADLVILADVVKALADEVEWVFFGLCPEGVRQLVEYHAGIPLDEYPAKLAGLNLDLALAPLEDVPFNHAKSNLRLLEYGVLGYPVICTDITPYRGDYPVTRVKNRFKDWVDAIREHLSDMDELARRGDALRDHIEANWMLEDNLDAWRKAWFPA